MSSTRTTRAVYAVLAGGLATATIAGCGGGNSTASTSTTPTVTVTDSTTSPTPGASSSGAGSPSDTGASGCRTSDLTITLGQGNAATSHRYFPLTFTNSGSSACTLDGFPGVSFVAGAGGTQVGNPATQDGPRTGAVTLQPGSAATATIGMTTVGPYDPATCHQVQAAGFRVYPPNETQAAFVASVQETCSAKSLTMLTITAVTTS